MIDSFSGENRFLSNFWPAEVTLDGMTFPSVENAYQAAKTNVLIMREDFINLIPGQAKRKGQNLPLRNDWESVKVSVMRNLLEQKFEHEELRKLLLNTGEQQLVEGNTWGDIFWGVCDNVGDNNLGKLLMEIREQIRNHE